ncbi:hypothetical protein AA310_11480 [Arthrobacter sp. YC-RL1]|nr:hypothetical protein ATC04_06535 [Arthrobacter sp. YC-RL1]KLI88428.1 hypothetical protein AA310_11480 [Arthrobacter sp. YC-RL1]
MVEGGDFSIADALGPEVTSLILNSTIAGQIPMQGAISGIISALADKSPEIQQGALEQDIPFETAAGLHIRTRDIAAASRWIAAALESKLTGNDDPISTIQADIAKELNDSGALGNAAGMSKYLAAVTLVGAAANFPDNPPTNIKAAEEMAAIADAAEIQGMVTPAMIQIVIEKGATFNLGGVHGNDNVVASGDNSTIEISNAPNKHLVKSSRNHKPVFWKNLRFYGWLIPVLIAALTLYATLV